jgi:hypothetical protein
MRILTLGGKMLTDALRDRGHEVLSLSGPASVHHPHDRETDFFAAPEQARGTVRELSAAFRPDWILQVDDSTPLPHLGLEALSIPMAWYAVDTHLHWEWHRHYAPLFDVVFCAQKNQLDRLAVYREAARGSDQAAVRAAVAWLPLSFTAEPAFLPWDTRAHDIAFVGTLDPVRNPGRIALLDALKARGLPVHAVQGACEPVYRAARVVINQSARDDLNFRFFEAMGYGALLITDAISHSLEDMGEPGADFLVYAPGDADDLAAKFRWALEHPAAAEAMARRGQEKVLAHHRIGQRMERLEEVLGRAGRTASLAGGSALGHLAAAHEHLSRLALPAPLTAFFATEARRLAEAALDVHPGEPWAALALAQLDLERGAHAEALARLESGDGSEGGAEYRRRFLFLRGLLLALGGRALEARRIVEAGLREFPGDADLARLGGTLNR